MYGGIQVSRKELDIVTVFLEGSREYSSSHIVKWVSSDQVKIHGQLCVEYEV